MKIPRRGFVASLLALPFPFFFRTKFVTATEDEKNLLWGTYGKYGNEPLQEKRLDDCDTDHLQAILKNQHQIPPNYTQAICNILSERGVKNPRKLVKKDPMLTWDIAKGRYRV